MMKAYQYYLDHGGKKSLRDYMRMATGAGRKGGGRELFRAEGGRVGYRVGGAPGREYDRGGSRRGTSSPSFDRPTMADVAGPTDDATWAPTISNISVLVTPTYSRETLKQFSLQKFASGELSNFGVTDKNKNSGIGFI